MSISRRHFLRAGAVTLAAAGAPVSLKTLAAGRAARGSAGAPAASTLMTKATFAPLLNTAFTIEPQSAPAVRVKLIGLHDCGAAPGRSARAGQECFALAFSVPAGRALSQDTYRVEHGALGQFDLFLGPVKSDRHGRLYEAIINHARD